jgi:hypothetical protein
MTLSQSFTRLPAWCPASCVNGAVANSACLQWIVDVTSDLEGRKLDLFAHAREGVKTRR